MSVANGVMMASLPGSTPSEETNRNAELTFRAPPDANGTLETRIDGHVGSDSDGQSTQDTKSPPKIGSELELKTKIKEPSAITENLKRTVEDPIGFTDPSGQKWTLPFEHVKTWEQMRLVIEKIFPWDDAFDEELNKESRDHLSLWQVPEELRILPERKQISHEYHGISSLPKYKSQSINRLLTVPPHSDWNQTVKPGSSFALRYEGNRNWLAVTLENLAKETQGVEKKDTEKEEIKPEDVTYVARIYQEQSESRHPLFLREKTYTKPLTAQIQGISKDANSVLHEIRNVFIGLPKEKLAKSPTYDRIHSDDVIGSCVVQINSSILMDALRVIVQFQCPDDEERRSDSGFDLPGWRNASDLRTGRFIFPFPDLCYHIDDLFAYKSSTCASRQRHSKEYNDECDRHIDVLLKYLYNQPSLGVENARAAWSQKVPITTFGWLWLLFKPGSDVYVRERGQLNGYVVETVTGMAKSSNTRANPLTIKVWNLDFDGEKLVRLSKVIILPAFDGEREIRSLPLFPTRFHSDKEGDISHRDLLIQRGKTFVKVVMKPKFQEYTGNSSFYQGRTFSKARVIVDHTSKAWFTEIGRDQENKHIPSTTPDEKLGLHIRIPECSCAVCFTAGAASDNMYRRLTFDDYDNITLDSCGDLTDHQYFLCFSHVYAYCLQDRLWDLIDVRGLKPPRIDKSVIDTLVMRPASNKAMIKALCETYSQKEDREMLFFADYIRGKGEGQILLLHGPPGTGKTLTAESVAEYTERPLLGITAADLGHEPEQLEKNLLKFFRNASKWDAIVLLDEADVYLERRSVNELRRNSIVSIFLRALDYFQGILFLTTNRVGSFDEAFMSRIHIQIGYDPLDDESRKQIWMNSFKKLATNHKQGGREIQYSFTAKEFVTTSTKLKDLKWNGREIRNAFQTAVALASYEARQSGESVPTLTEDHFSQVVDMSTNFKQYMKSALQNDEADLAYMNRLRDDRFTRGRDN